MSSVRKVKKVFAGGRGLGLGFGEGNSFHLFSSQPNRGQINELPLAKEAIAKLRNELLKEIQENKTGKTMSGIIRNFYSQQFSDVDGRKLDEMLAATLALILPDLLVDMNITRLERILPDMLAALPKDIKALLTKDGLKPFNDAEGKRFLRSILVSKYKLYRDEDGFNQKLKELEANLTPEKIHTIDSDILSYLIPALLDRMGDVELKATAFAMGNLIQNKYFRSVAVENYFIPDLKADANDKMLVRNENKRSLQFLANSTSTRVNFRGGDYSLQHTHIHFERDGEENEYDLDGKKFDGEIHSVFEINHKSKDGNINKRLMAIGLPLQIGEHNADIQKLLDNINQLEVVKAWREKLTASKETTRPQLTLSSEQLEMTDYKQLFLKYYDQAKAANKLMYHSWGSLRADTYGFYAGLRFVIAPIAITMSQEQYRQLREIFGEMKLDLTEEQKLDPIDRKAGRRQERTAILNALHEMTAQKSVNKARM